MLIWCSYRVSCILVACVECMLCSVIWSLEVDSMRVVICVVIVE